MDQIKKVLPQTLEMAMFAGQPWTEEKAQALQEATAYKNRERIPEHLLTYADLYNEITGQEAIGYTDWIATFEEWKTHGLLREHIVAAWNEANKDSGGFPVGRPGALTTVAVSAKSKMTHKAVPQINQDEIEKTKQSLSEKWDDGYVPPSAETLATAREQVKKALAESRRKREAERDARMKGMSQ